jgi:Uma2 family endonuclease
MMILATIGAREESTHVATAQPAVKLTYDDYRATPDDERYELLDGELTVVPAPNLKHQEVLGNLHYLLRRFITEHESGRLLLAPCDVVLSDTDIVQPDLLFVSREREHLLSSGQNVQGAPDLVVEILSPSTVERDRGEKRALYGKYGVTEYWLVDPIAETVSIHRQRAGVLAVTRTFGREQTLRSALLAGLELRLDDVFSS